MNIRTHICIYPRCKLKLFNLHYVKSILVCNKERCLTALLSTLAIRIAQVHILYSEQGTRNTHHFLLESFFINFGSLSLTTGIILFMIIEWNLLAATSKVKIITKQRRFLASVIGIVTLNTFS